MRYATSWAFAKAEDGKPYFQPSILRQLRATKRYVLGVGFLLTNEEILQAIGEDKGRTDFMGEVVVNWVARCAEQSGSLSGANLMYLLSSKGLLISIRDEYVRLATKWHVRYYSYLTPPKSRPCALFGMYRRT